MNHTPEEQEFWDARMYGEIDPLRVCPHCNEKGCVRVKSVKRHSKKERVNQAYCGRCEKKWTP